MVPKIKLNYIFNKVSLTITSMRPTTWIRFWAEMIVAAALAGKEHFQFNQFILGFLCLGPLLWGAAYMLNDLTDIKLDLQHPLKKNRPIALGKLSQKESLLFIFLLFTLAVYGSLFINTLFVLILFILTLSEVLYTLSPFRFKERLGLDILTNGANSVLKFMGGYLTQTEVINYKIFPWFPLMLFVCIKIILFVGHRFQSRKIELKNKLSSTITKLSFLKIKILIGILTISALSFFLLSVRNQNFPLISIFVLPSGLIPFLPGIINLKRETLMTPERSLTFRVHLYLTYFVLANLLSYLILYNK